MNNDIPKYPSDIDDIYSCVLCGKLLNPIKDTRHSLSYECSCGINFTFTTEHFGYYLTLNNINVASNTSNITLFYSTVGKGEIILTLGSFLASKKCK